MCSSSIAVYNPENRSSTVGTAQNDDLEEDTSSSPLAPQNGKIELSNLKTNCINS